MRPGGVTIDDMRIRSLLLGLALLAGALPTPASAATQEVVLAGGCFWGMQAVFESVKGVTDVVAGYSGGGANTAHYEMVSTGTTGHAESVDITFDPSQVSFRQLLQVYFLVAHDPTELDRQGPDNGTQYRSEIYYTTPRPARAGTSRDRLARTSTRLRGPDRDDARTAARLLSRRGLPSGLSGEQPERAIYRLQRSAQTARPARSDFPRWSNPSAAPMRVRRRSLTRRETDRAVQPDHLTVEHLIFEDVTRERRVFGRTPQARRKRRLLAERLARGFR